MIIRLAHHRRFHCLSPIFHHYCPCQSTSFSSLYHIFNIHISLYITESELYFPSLSWSIRYSTVDKKKNWYFIVYVRINLHVMAWGTKSKNRFLTLRQIFKNFNGGPPKLNVSNISHNSILKLYSSVSFHVRI